MRLIYALFVLLYPAMAMAAEPAPAAIDAKPALWKVGDADTTIWLFGTIHMLGPNIDWFRGPVAKAFGQAQELVVETELPDPQVAQGIVLKLAYDLAGPPLAQKLPPALYARTAAEMKALGVPDAIYARADPWYTSVLLEMVAYQKLGLAAEGGVEIRLLGDARKSGKTIVPLEGFEEQLGIFDQFDSATQIALLESTLDDVPDAEKHVRSLIDTWTKGDEASLERALNEDMDTLPQVRARLVDQRNDRFAAWIAKRLDRPGTVFLAVGAGHLGGAHNVRGLLEAKGYKVERVQ